MKMSPESFNTLSHHLPYFLARRREIGNLSWRNLCWESLNDLLDSGRVTFSQVSDDDTLTDPQIETAMKKIERETRRCR